MSQSTHVFHKRTRKGKVLRVVQECYTRSDCGVGYLRGKQLPVNDLQEFMDGSKTLLVLDTNILLHHMDVLEHDEFLKQIVVVCQTVLSELHNQDSSLFKRATSLLTDPKRCFIFYPNEFSMETIKTR
jgi:exosome complex exonuclease DIS3/RRP44